MTHVAEQNTQLKPRPSLDTTGAGVRQLTTLLHGSSHFQIAMVDTHVFLALNPMQSLSSAC